MGLVRDKPRESRTVRLRTKGGLVAFVALIAALAALGPAASADTEPDLAALRAQLASAQAADAGKLPEGVFLSIAYTLDVAERIQNGFAPQAAIWRARAARLLDAVGQGRDPFPEQAGKLLMRGYRSPLSLDLQGYGIYLPPGYDPSRAYPLVLVLHGGSANGNLFLAVVLGNNMNWKEYAQHLWDEYLPRYTPDCIVVAPDGFGQVMWRFMGEQDVLDVIADVERHYRVDEDRVTLAGLSNGGVGAYNVGLRHAWRFNVVQAIAGAPSWLQYAGGEIDRIEQRTMAAQSGMQVAENAIDTAFQYHHGHVDPGPMKPRFVEEFGRHIASLGVPFKERWYDAGHDLLYIAQKHGRVFDEFAQVKRERRPREVRVQTGDYRAARQHWVSVTRIDGYPTVARVRAVAEGDTIEVETRNVRAFSLDLRDVPLTPPGVGAAHVTLRVDGKVAYDGARAPLGSVIHLLRAKDGFTTGFPPEGALEKKPGSSGPLTDAYYGPTLHVYGTLDPAATAKLKAAAERGAQGWPLWLWHMRQRVLADTELTDELARTHNLVLYATPGSHSTLERIAKSLPIRVESDAVVLGSRRITAPGVGVRFIYPSPLGPGHYVTVQAAPTVAAVLAGHELPDFLPDYVVYDARSTATRPRLVPAAGLRAPPARGYFDDHWQLDLEAPGDGSDEQPELAPSAGSVPDATPAATPGSAAAPAPPPAAPPAASELPSSPTTQAGKAARQITKLVASFTHYRERIPRGSWTEDAAARWSIRDNQPCLAALREAAVPFREHAGELATPVAAPVEITGPIEGVRFQMIHADRPLLFACELAVRLPVLARVLRAHGIHAVAVISAYRDHPRTSFHTLGMAIDMWRFFGKERPDEPLSVLTDFERTPDHATCEAPAAKTAKGAVLRDIACELARTHVFSSVLTPNYNEGHHDHFHLDVRPDDPRFFAR